MPENTEVLNKKDDIVAPENVEKDSGTDSDSDNDSIPELEETGAGAGQTQGKSMDQCSNFQFEKYQNAWSIFGTIQ